MMNEAHTSRFRLDGFRYLSPGSDPAWRRAVGRVIDLRNVGWDVGVRALERMAGYRRGDRLDFHLGASARDLISGKSRAVRDEVEALADAVMKAGAYPAREEAARALGAVMHVLGDRVPPDLLAKLGDHLPLSEAARLRRATPRRENEEGAAHCEGAALEERGSVAEGPSA